jgi:transcriptional regulator with XRE-family HTH domain
MTYGDKFQRNLDRYMKAENISHNSVAKSAGVAQKTVWSVVTGRSIPSLNTAEIVAKTAGVDARVMVSKELSPQQVSRSKKIGRMLDQMIDLNAEQLDTVGGVLRAFTSTE